MMDKWCMTQCDVNRAAGEEVEEEERENTQGKRRQTSAIIGVEDWAKAKNN